MPHFIFANTGANLAVRALRKHHRRADGVLFTLRNDTSAPVVPRTRAGLATATWTFSSGSHIITLGHDYLDMITQGPKRSTTPTNMDRHALRLADALLRHEAWHGRSTVRDLEALAKEAKARRVPFGILNLFEDVRIEAKARDVEKDLFQWRNWLTVSPTDNPTVALSNCATIEGWHGASIAYWTGSVDDRVKIRDFYERACKATDTWQALALAEEWCNHWDAQGRADHRAMSTATAPRASDAIGATTDGSVTVAAPAGGTVHGSYRNGSDCAPTTVPRRHQWTYYVDATKTEPLDPVRVNRLASRLERVMGDSASPRTARVSTSGNRLHMAGVMTGSAQSFRTHGKVGGKPTITVVMDFSGSMSDDFAAHGRPFLAALMQLAQRGVIDATIIATGGNAHAILPTTMSTADLNRLLPNKNTESIAITLDACKQAVQDADVTVVYTDARITDGAVDAAAWRRRGVELVGAVVCPYEQYLAYTQEDMLKHFGRAVIGTTGEDLAVKLAQYLATRVGR